MPILSGIGAKVAARELARGPSLVVGVREQIIRRNALVQGAKKFNRSGISGLGHEKHSIPRLRTTECGNFKIS